MLACIDVVKLMYITTMSLPFIPNSSTHKFFTLHLKFMYQNKDGHGWIPISSRMVQTLRKFNLPRTKTELVRRQFEQNLALVHESWLVELEPIMIKNWYQPACILSGLILIHSRLNQLGVWTVHDRLIYQDNLKYESYLIGYTSITKHPNCRSPFLHRTSSYEGSKYVWSIHLKRSLSLPAL